MERLVFDGVNKGSWKFRIIQLEQQYYLLKVRTDTNKILEMEMIPQDDIMEYITPNI